MTGVIIQARIGSSRLPGKVLMRIGARNLLEHILGRLSRLKHPVQVVVATTLSWRDDAIKDFCRERGVYCFRGSEENVLERYLQCAQHFGFDHIVRLTGDNPFTDMEELDRLIELHLSTGSPYSTSCAALPTGVGAEVFTIASLEESQRRATLPAHFEHVNEYILDNSSDYFISELDVPAEKRMPLVRLTIDTPEDYERACYIVERSDSEYVGTLEAIRLAGEFGR